MAEWYVPQGGLFLWIKVTAVDDVLDLANKCVSQGVFVTPGNAFNYNSSKHDCHLRFSYSYPSLEEMDKVNLKIIFILIICQIICHKFICLCTYIIKKCHTSKQI